MTTSAIQSMKTALASEFPDYTIDMYLREVAHDIDQAYGTFDDAVWRAKHSARHFFGRKYETNAFVISALEAAKEVHNASAKYSALKHGFASSCTTCRSCKAEIDLIKEKAL
jgi:hypothetical protein